MPTPTRTSSFSRQGDIFLSNSYDLHPTNKEPDPGEAGFAGILHEIGHALGLKHPFEGNDTLAGDQDGDIFTAMSFNEHPEADVFVFEDLGSGTFSFGGSPHHTETPMLADIAAIRFLYGTNTSISAGDTIYAIADGEELIRTIYDVGGNETVDLSAAAVDQRLDLTPDSFSDINFPNGNDIPALPARPVQRDPGTRRLEPRHRGGHGDRTRGWRQRQRRHHHDRHYRGWAECR